MPIPRPVSASRCCIRPRKRRICRPSRRSPRSLSRNDPAFLPMLPLSSGLSPATIHPASPCGISPTDAAPMGNSPPPSAPTGNAPPTPHGELPSQVQKRLARLQRQDMLHKLSTDLVRQNDVICLEDLAPSNLDLPCLRPAPRQRHQRCQEHPERRASPAGLANPYGRAGHART